MGSGLSVIRMNRYNRYSVVLLFISIIISPASIAYLAVGQQSGGTLVIAMVSEPTQIAAVESWNGGFVAAQLFDGLLRFDEKLNPVPGLAERFVVNSTGGYYVFTLRSGVKFHDGTPVTPEDVKFSFENIIPKYTAFGAQYFANTTVEIVNSTTVIIKPGRFLPGAQLLLFAASDRSPILPKHILEGKDFLKSDFITTKPIGTGPYKLSAWVKGQYIELVRNPDYWDKGKPYLDKIIIRFISDPTALIAALKRGEINYVFRGIPYEAIPDLKADPKLRVILHDRPPYVAALWINVKSGPLSDVRVRQAIAYTLNKTDIALKATFGVSEPIDYMFDPALVPPSPGIFRYEYNIAMAEKLLDEAGYKKGPDGKRFSIELMTRTGEPDEQVIAQLVRDQLAKIGIEVNIKTVDFATYLSLQTKLQYQMATVKYWIAPIWSYQLFHSNWIGKGAWTNNFQYSNPEVDSLLDQWLREADPSKQTTYLQRVEDILSRDLPVIVLYRVRWINVVSQDIGGSDIPVGKWVFSDPLVNTYYKTQQMGGATTPQAMITQATQTTPKNQTPQATSAISPAIPQPGISSTGSLYIAVFVVVALIAISLLILRLYRRR